MESGGPVDVRSYCRICPVQCGIVVTVEGDRVLRVRGDEEHPLSRGYTCPKGRALPAFHHHPHRLDTPELRPPGGELAATGWTELLDDLAARVRGVLDDVGPDGVAWYFGTWSWLDALGRRTTDRLVRAIGSKSVYSAVTVDAVARSYVAELMGGSSALLPNLDPDGTGLTVLVGSNPAVSHGHASAMADPIAKLRAIERRAGLWVLDPLRTASAQLATRHLQVRPGSDPAVLAHLIRELLVEGADRPYLADHASGVEELASAVRPFSREVAAGAAGVSPADLDELVAAVRGSGHVTVLTGTGTTMAAAGNLTEWLAWAVQIVTGSFDRPGGAWFNPGWVLRLDGRGENRRDGTPDPGPASRPDLARRFGEYPCAALADEIAAGNVRALFVVGGSPLTSLPDTGRLRRELRRLDVLAVADVVRTETVELATHVLPATGQLERADVTFYVELFLSAVAAQFTGPVVAPVHDRRPVWWVLASVAQRLGLDVLDGGLDPATATEAQVLDAFVASRNPPERPPPGAATFVADPPRPKGWVTAALPGGRWRLAPEPLVGQLAAWHPPDAGALVATPRRVVRRMNSSVGDVVATAPRPADLAVLLSPADADRLGVDGHRRVTVRSAVGEISAVVEVDDAVLPGTVSVPHGLRAQNVNELTDTRPGTVDPLTGMIVQSGIPVTVTPEPTRLRPP